MAVELYLDAGGSDGLASTDGSSEEDLIDVHVIGDQLAGGDAAVDDIHNAGRLQSQAIRRPIKLRHAFTNHSMQKRSTNHTQR